MIEIIVFIFGLVVGSFLNVLIDRIPYNEDIVWTPSHCDHCKKRLRWFELFPVVSYVAFGGRCKRCKRRLSLQYPIVELLTALGFVLLMRFTPVSWPMILAFFFIYSIALVIVFIDAKHQIIPDMLLVMLVAIGLVILLPFPPVDRIVHFWSAVFAGLFFFVLWLITRGRGLGFGDVKLASVIGLFLGHPKTLIGMYAAFLTGAILSVILIITRRARMKSRIAFGPFLIIGAGISALWGESIWRIWLTLF